MIDRKYSDGAVWSNRIDCNDAPDGSEGGYDAHGNYITPNAMKEIVQGRRSLEAFAKRIRELEAVKAEEK